MTFKINNRSTRKVALMATVSAVALLALFSSDVFASEQALTAQLDKVTALTSGSVAKTGLIVGTIACAITGLFKNSWMIFISAISIGMGLSYYLEYLKVWGS